MNKIVNKSLLKGDKFMPKLHPKQPVLTYSSCGPFSEHSERIQKLKETGGLKHIYKKELDETCLLVMQHVLIVKIYLKQLFRIRF